MDKKKIFEDLYNNINQMIINSPVKDIEKNIRALITQAFSKLDLITREEFDVQANLIAQLQEQVNLLQTRLDNIAKRDTPSNE